MKQYLGDGVYADHDGFAIHLTTENGIATTNAIVIEPEVMRALEVYVANFRAGILSPKTEPARAADSESVTGPGSNSHGR